MLCCIENLGGECTEEDGHISRRGMLIALYSM